MRTDETKPAICIRIADTPSDDTFEEIQARLSPAIRILYTKQFDSAADPLSATKLGAELCDYLANHPS